MSKVYNYKSKLHFTKFRELDDFIQNSLDKFFFVEPWKNLYENTEIFSRYIISNKSTIPDLIIFNKTFNKNDCYEGADRNYFNKFPRMRFILRPRYKQFYNPCDTIGKDESFFIGNKNFNSEKRVSGKNNNYKNQNNKYMKPLKKYIPEGDFEDGFILSKLSPDNIFETNNNPNDNNNLNDRIDLNKNEEKKEEKENKKNETIEFNLFNKIPEKKLIPQSKVNEEQYDDEEEPEWENDDVNNYTTRITFQEIPKDLKEKAEKEIDKREKVDVYNNKILQTLNVDNKIDNNDKNETEEILKFDENKNGNIFEQLESFLKSDEKKTENQNENFNNDFFDKYNNNSNNNIFNNNFSFNSNFNKSKKKNNLMYNNNLNVNNINQNLQLQNLQLRYQIQQQQAQQAQLQLYFLQQQQYLNYIQMQNLQNQIKGFYIPNNQRNPMINMNMNMNFSLNNNNNNNSNIEGANNNNNKINFNNEENEEEDPMMNDFTTDSKYYNPTVFLENPALIVKKNLIEKNWFLMRDGKILGNYNSEELLFLLDEKIKEGNSFNNISISDYQTDVVFQPKILYEILKEHVSKIKKKYLESKFLNQVNNSNNNSNINSMSPFNNLNGNINQLFH